MMAVIGTLVPFTSLALLPMRALLTDSLSRMICLWAISGVCRSTQLRMIPPTSSPGSVFAPAFKTSKKSPLTAATQPVVAWHMALGFSSPPSTVLLASPILSVYWEPKKVSRRTGACTPYEAPAIGYTLIPFVLAAPDAGGAILVSALNASTLVIPTTTTASTERNPRLQVAPRRSLIRDGPLRRNGRQSSGPPTHAKTAQTPGFCQECLKRLSFPRTGSRTPSMRGEIQLWRCRSSNHHPHPPRTST